MNKANTTLIGLVFASTGFLSGCAPMIAASMAASTTDNDVFEKTATYFGTSRDNLVISAIDHGALGTTYQTRYDGKFYNCKIYYGAVSCEKPGGG